MPASGANRRSTQAGFTILEMMVVIIILGIIIAYALPRFQKALEQSRVDLAASNLQTIWTSERLYWAQNNTFASSISALQSANLLDPSFVNNVEASGSPFAYAIPASDSISFTATATRANSSFWSGSLSINEQGTLAGSTTGGSTTITPSTL